MAFKDLPARVADMSPEQLRAVLGYPRNFARITDHDGDEIHFAYDLDSASWPWLVLPAGHPVLIEKYQYFSSVTAAWAFGDMRPGVRSALTRMRWSVCHGADDAHYPVHGECRRRAGVEGLQIDVALQDASGATLARFECSGHAFEDRDFAGWRAGSRARVLEAGSGPAFETAPLDGLGLPAGTRSFVSAPRQVDGRAAVLARVGRAEGFHPQHPFHTGTGDHVNAGQLFDCGLQAAGLLCALPGPPTCTHGAVHFQRFVELDAVFEIHLLGRSARGGATRVELLFRQAGRDNAALEMTLAAA